MNVRNIPSGMLMVNTYYVIDEKTKKGFIVDPGGFDKKLCNLAEQDGIDLEYIVLTHGHVDHIGGVSEYREHYPNIKVIAAKAELPMLSDPDYNMSSMMGMAPITVVPDITVVEGDELTVGNINMRFVMTPGHSPGGMCIIIDEEKVVFSGDTLFAQSVGRTDFPGGSFSQLIESIRAKLFVLDDDVIVYPGHMGPTRIGIEKRHNPFV